MKDAFTTVLYDAEYRITSVIPMLFNTREDAVLAGKEAIDGDEVFDYDVFEHFVDDDEEVGEY